MGWGSELSHADSLPRCYTSACEKQSRVGSVLGGKLVRSFLSWLRWGTTKLAAVHALPLCPVLSLLSGSFGVLLLNFFGGGERLPIFFDPSLLLLACSLCSGSGPRGFGNTWLSGPLVCNERLLELRRFVFL